MGLIQPSITSTTEARRSTGVVQPSTPQRPSGYLSRIGGMIRNNYGKIVLLGLAALVAVPLNAIYRINQMDPRRFSCSVARTIGCDIRLVNQPATYQWSSQFPWVQQVNSMDWTVENTHCDGIPNSHQETTILQNLRELCIPRANTDLGSNHHDIRYTPNDLNETPEGTGPEATIRMTFKQIIEDRRRESENRQNAGTDLTTCEQIFADISAQLKRGDRWNLISKEKLTNYYRCKQTHGTQHIDPIVLARLPE